MKKIKISYISTPKQLVVTLNGKSYLILKTDPGYEKIYNSVKTGTPSGIESLLGEYGYIKTATKKIVKEFNKKSKNSKIPKLKVDNNGNITVSKLTFNNKLTKKIADWFYSGYDITAYYKLLDKIARNPDNIIQSGLLDFIAANDLPITTNGTFLAYKVTRSDGYDHHSGTILYEVGKCVEMDREKVDSSRGVCSGRGLYFASINYYKYHLGDDTSSKRFLVEVDPMDVVSIPTTYENSKGRCCKMKVVRDIGWSDNSIPPHTEIINLDTWAPPVKNAKKVKKASNVEIGGTQKLKTEDVKAKLIKYVNGRLKAGKIPTIRNAQKAVKGVSVGDIRNILYDAGYLLAKDGKVFTLSNVRIKNKNLVKY